MNQSEKAMQPLRLLITSILATLFIVSYASAETWKAGKHYQVLPYQVATDNPDKIEVTEVFWYGCPHCYEFNNNHLPAWEAAFPDDVAFTLMHATFPNWQTHAKAYFAIEALDQVHELHQKVFDAIIASPNRYKSDDDVQSLLVSLGVPKADVESVFEASGFRRISKIDEAINKATERVRAYRVAGVPALIVNGKYKIGVRDAGGFQNMIKVANYLIAKERKLKQP